MKSQKTWSVFLALVLLFAGTIQRAQGQNGNPSGEGTQAASTTASKAEVEELRKELAAQRRTIERLQTLIEQLAEIKARAPAPAADGAHLVNASLTLPATAAEVAPEAPAEPYQKPPEKKEDALPVTAGWNGEHFFIKSADSAFQIQAGQFKEPFAQELVAGVTNIDFVERGLQSLLYPSAASAYRSPGVVIHGDIKGGVFQYWAGAFNGKGYATNNTTSVPESVGRIRFYPWRNNKDSVLQGLAFGGSIAYSQAHGLSNEVTPSMALPDTAYTFLPQFQA